VEKKTRQLGHVKLIIWFSDTDFQKNDEGGRVFNFCIYMHIGPIFRFQRYGTKVDCITCLIEVIHSNLVFYSLDIVFNVHVDECYY
jgi:hypothetical protein